MLLLWTHDFERRKKNKYKQKFFGFSDYRDSHERIKVKAIFTTFSSETVKLSADIVERNQTYSHGETKNEDG